MGIKSNTTITDLVTSFYTHNVDKNGIQWDFLKDLMNQKFNNSKISYIFPLTKEFTTLE